MKLASNEKTLAESKVLILYILNKISHPVTNNTLYKIVLSALDMNYFYFQQFLLDLIKNDFILNYEQSGQNMYMITDKGVNTLELTEDILPGILKLQVDTNLKYTLENAAEENSIVAEYTPVNENYYNVTCKIMENNECIFEVKTFAGSGDQAKQIVENWKKHAGIIYPDLLKILTQDFTNTDDETSENADNTLNHEDLGSPMDVYNYDVINRPTELENSNNPNTAAEKENQANSNSDIIEGNMNIFDLLDKNDEKK